MIVVIEKFNLINISLMEFSVKVGLLHISYLNRILMINWPIISYGYIKKLYCYRKKTLSPLFIVIWIRCTNQWSPQKQTRMPDLEQMYYWFLMTSLKKLSTRITQLSSCFTQHVSKYFVNYIDFLYFSVEGLR